MNPNDPVIGVWDYNAEKSKYINPPTLFEYLSATRTFTLGPEGISSSVTAVLADGTPFSEGMAVLNDDGDYHPHWGNPYIDMMAVERLDAGSTMLTAKKEGKVVGAGTRTISDDGKVLRMTFVYLDADGILRGHVTHYDKREG